LVRTPSVVFEINSIAAAAVAAIVGYVAITIVKRFVLSNRFHLFAIYCFLLGLAVIIYAL
jgi:undecaprenyl pyrophosphate phosphatase UppP